MKPTYTCLCGTTLQEKSKKKHLLSKKHIETLRNACNPDLTETSDTIEPLTAAEEAEMGLELSEADKKEFNLA